MFQFVGCVGRIARPPELHDLGVEHFLHAKHSIIIDLETGVVILTESMIFKESMMLRGSTILKEGTIRR